MRSEASDRGRDSFFPHHDPPKELSRASTIGGRFEVIERLGRGGMGTVYRVLDNKINEEIVRLLGGPELTEAAVFMGGLTGL